MFNEKSSHSVAKQPNSSSNTNSRDKFSFVVLLGLVLLLPLFFIPLSTFSFLFSKTILISLVTIALSLIWIVSRLKDGTFTTTRSKILLFAVAIPVVYLVSSFFSGSIMVSLVGQGYEIGTTMFTVMLFLLLFLTTSILNTKEKIYNVFFVFFISFVILSLYQISRLIFGAEFLSFGVLTSSNSSLIGKWNELSIFYGLTSILSLLIIEFINNSKVIKTLGYITLAVSLFFIALVNLSLVWIVVGLFAFVLISYIFSSNRVKAGDGEKTKKFPIISFLVVLLTVIVLLGNVSGNGNNIGGALSSAFSISNTEVRPSWQGTYDIAKNTLSSKQVLLGAGPNKFVNQWSLYKPVEINDTVFWNTDFNTGVSYLFTSAITVGVLGLLLWLAFLGSLLYTGFRAMFISSENKIDNYLLPFSFLTTIYLWIFSLLYVPSHSMMALTFIFTGALVSLLIQNKVIETKKVSFANNQKIDFILVLVLIFLVLVSVVGAYTVSQKFVADVYSRKGLAELNNEEGLVKTEEGIIKAISISGNDAYYRFLSEINLVQLQGLLQEESISSEEELQNQFQLTLEKAVINGQKAVEIDSTNYQNWIALGRVYETVMLFGIEGAYDQAVNSYIRAVNLNPQNPQLFFTLGVLDYNQENYENALIVLEKAVILRPVYSDAKYFLALTYNKLGRTADAIAQFEDIKYLNPESKEVDIILDNIGKGKDPFVGLEGVSTPVQQIEEDDIKEDEEL